jgi:hypothetical protein
MYDTQKALKMKINVKISIVIDGDSFNAESLFMLEKNRTVYDENYLPAC